MYSGPKRSCFFLLFQLYIFLLLAFVSTICVRRILSLHTWSRRNAAYFRAHAMHWRVAKLLVFSFLHGQHTIILYIYCTRWVWKTLNYFCVWCFFHYVTTAHTTIERYCNKRIILYYRVSHTAGIIRLRVSIVLVQTHKHFDFFFVVVLSRETPRKRTKTQHVRRWWSFLYVGYFTARVFCFRNSNSKK